MPYCLGDPERDPNLENHPHQNRTRPPEVVEANEPEQKAAVSPKSPSPQLGAGDALQHRGAAGHAASHVRFDLLPFTEVLFNEGSFRATKIVGK